MYYPALSIIVPTKGRESLSETLQTIPQRLEWVETIVVADGPVAHQVALQACANRKRTRVYRTTRTATVGHDQRTLGMKRARGRWVAFIDDDDLYTKKAFDAFARHMATDARNPCIFKMRYQTGYMLWGVPEIAFSNVGTPMILCRNSKLGHWEPCRGGDFTFIKETVDLNGGCVWDDTVVAIIRDFGDKT